MIRIMLLFFVVIAGCSGQIESPPKQTPLGSSVIDDSAEDSSGTLGARALSCKAIERACKKACAPGDLTCVAVCKAAKTQCTANLAPNPPPTVTAVTYVQDVQPLMTYCNGCHGAAPARGAYRTDSYAGLLGTGSDGLANVIPGDTTSRLVTYTSLAVNHETANTAVPGIAGIVSDWVMGGALLDNTAQAIVTNVASVNVNEGGSVTLTVKLAADPIANATVSIALSNTGPAAVNPQTLTFTSADFAMPQTISLSGLQDVNTISESLIMSLSSAGMPLLQVAVNVLDDDTPPVTTVPPGNTVPPVAGSQVFLGVGNIGHCGADGTNITAADVAASGTQASGLLLDAQMRANPGATAFTVGDNQYNSASPYEFTNCYDKTAWGTYKAQTRAVMGDHDTKTIVNGGYYSYSYFGPNSGTPAQHWYSYDLGAWHIVVLDSNVTSSLGSSQNNWLRSDLAANTKSCTMALFHHPYFSAGGINTATTKPMWDALYEFGADVIFSAHVHAYQRLAPMRPDGTSDPVYGIRSFVVGTGGATLANLPAATGVTEAQNSGTFGIVKFALSDNAYNWQFIPVAGKTFTDSGSGTCHGKPVP